jgi:hypothetical protein
VKNSERDFVRQHLWLPLILVCAFLQKKKHHQLKTVLCGRCVLLSQGAMIPAVSGNGGYGEGKGFVSADELRAQLTHLKYEKALIVKLVRLFFQLCEFYVSFLLVYSWSVPTISD